MTKKIVIATYLIIVGLVCAIAVEAAEQDNKLLGYWQKKGEAVVLEMKQVDGKIEGIIVRADWEPGLVEKVFVRNIEFESDSENWKGEFYDTRSDQFRQGSISARKSDTLSIKVKGRRRVSWIKTESKSQLK